MNDVQFAVKESELAVKENEFAVKEVELVVRAVETLLINSSKNKAFRTIHGQF